jgi:hypothetical protein
MSKKKVAHRIYTGRHAGGSSTYKNHKFGKCLCGAVLEGEEAIAEHKLLEDDHLTKKAG